MAIYSCIHLSRISWGLLCALLGSSSIALLALLAQQWLGAGSLQPVGRVGAMARAPSRLALAGVGAALGIMGLDVRRRALRLEQKLGAESDSNRRNSSSSSSNSSMDYSSRRNADQVQQVETKSAADPSQAVFAFYMHIWNVFYGCYFLLPFLRL